MKDGLFWSSDVLAGTQAAVTALAEDKAAPANIDIRIETQKVF